MVALIAFGDMAITKYYNKKMKKVSIMLPDYNGGRTCATLDRECARANINRLRIIFDRQRFDQR